MSIKCSNIFSDLPDNTDEENVERLLSASDLTLQRIISRGQHTPDGQWYDQHENEWVILIKGAATLLIEEGHQLINMQAGDYVYLPAHCRHRVEWTDPEQHSIWLAVHHDVDNNKQNTK